LKRIKDFLSKGRGSRSGSSGDDSRAGTKDGKGAGTEDAKLVEEGHDALDTLTLFNELGTSPTGQETEGTSSNEYLDALFDEIEDSLETPKYPVESPASPIPEERTTAHPPSASKIDISPGTFPDRSGSDAGIGETGLQISSLKASILGMEKSVEGLTHNMQRLEGRQQATDKNIEDLLKSSELLSERFELQKPFAPAEGGHLPKGLPEHVPESGIRERSVPYPARYERFGPQVTHPGWPGGRALLECLGNDYATMVLVMRWIEFLFERVKRNRIVALLDYYEDIGWISSQVKSDIMAYARGEVQDVIAYEPDLDDSMASLEVDDDSEQILDDKGTPVRPHYRSMDDWKLSAEDHLKSLLFVKKIAGWRIDKDELNALEQEVSLMKYSLQRYHEV